MTDIEADPLLHAHRIVRRLADGEGPWPGAVTHLADGGAAMIVDVAELGEHWPGWSADADGHVLAPHDVVRSSSGHLVVLPVCTGRLGDVVRRRTGAGAPLSDGEAVTVLVSLVRGVRQLLGRAPEPSGAWWVTDAGRPVFACVEGDGAPPADAAAEVCDALGSGSVFVADAAAVFAQQRITAHDLDELEEALFRRATPAPLIVSSLLPRRARELDPVDREPVQATSALAASWLHLVDDDLRDLLSKATTGLWRRMRAAGRARRRGAAWGVAAAAGAAVLSIGLVWPAGADDSAVASSPSPSPSSASSIAPAVDEPPEPGPGDAPATDLVTATADLLDARLACDADRSCLADIVDDPARAFPPGVIDLPPSERTVTLLDEFGGAAVLRVDAVGASHPSQLVVVIEKDRKRLLRDVHDAAQQ